MYAVLKCEMEIFNVLRYKYCKVLILFEIIDS